MDKPQSNFVGSIKIRANSSKSCIPTFLDRAFKETNSRLSQENNYKREDTLQFKFLANVTLLKVGFA